MSGCRFLVSLKEVYRPESILKLKTFLSNNIELTSNISSITDEESSILQDFLETVNQENFDHITISQDAVDVIKFVSGYISRSLLNSLDCEVALTNDPALILMTTIEEASKFQHLHLIASHNALSLFSIIWNKGFLK